MVAPKNTSFASQIFTAAWMSIALGFLIEIALIIAAASFGKASNMRPFIADLAGKVSWSVLVCVGISIGTVAARARGAAMGALAATLVLMITVRTAAAPPPPLALVSKGINEVLFPLGCSIVLFAANTLGERTRLAVAT